MALRSTLMEETHKYRREWLWRLLEERFNNNKEAMSRAIHVSSGAVHDSLNKKRNVGERIARRVEEKLNLVPGSLDKPIGPQKRSPRDRRQSRPKHKQSEEALA